MKQLQSGQHFGSTKKVLRLEGTILTEAGYIAQMEVPWHYHENAYFFYQLRGRLDEINNKKSITCTPGTLLFHHWQDPHCDKNFSKDASFFHIELEPNWFSKHQINPSLLEGSFPIENPSLRLIFQKIYRESKVNDDVTGLSVDGMLLHSYASLIRRSHKEKSGTPGWVNKVREILHDSNRERITLQQLSHETGLHPVHLSKEFPKYFQTGFGEFIRHLRIEKAYGLLKSHTLSISEIAYQCGFADQSHFIRCFKSIHGITPHKFRNRIGED